MKKKFIAKKRKNGNFKVKFKFFLFLFFFIVSVSVVYNFYLKKNYIVDNKILVDLIMNNSSIYKKDSSLFKDTINNLFVPYKLISRNYKGLVNVSKKKEIKTVVKEEKKEYKPYIYIYNSHQSEEYIPSNYLSYTVKPTVSINNYIMEDVFKKNGYDVLVEERSIKDIINNNGWNYASSYRASRVYLDDVKKTYPSLEVFIDVHRGSLNRDKTTITIGDKNYAKIIFLIGLENSNYQVNLSFTEKINNIIESRYPGLSKGIYKKGGAGVNGVYNQDFSGKAILVEIGGVDNTIEEVMNSSIVVSNIISEVIQKDES